MLFLWNLVYIKLVARFITPLQGIYLACALPVGFPYVFFFSELFFFYIHFQLVSLASTRLDSALRFISLYFYFSVSVFVFSLALSHSLPLSVCVSCDCETKISVELELGHTWNNNNSNNNSNKLNVATISGQQQQQMLPRRRSCAPFDAPS